MFTTKKAVGKTKNGKKTDAKGKKEEEAPVKKRKPPKLVINMYYTCYSIVKKAAKELGFRIKLTDLGLIPNAQPVVE